MCVREIKKNAFNYFILSTSLCDLTPTDLKEFGVYNLTLYANGTCGWDVDNQGVDVNLCRFIFGFKNSIFLWLLVYILISALLSVFILVALILCVLKISLCAWRSYRYEEVLANAAANEAPIPPPTIQQRRRMRSLDAFRG